MIGRRVYPNEKEVIILQAGDYIFDPKGKYWVVKTPNGLVGGIQKHTVMEHEDKTITVSPSILISGYNYPEAEGELTWHGYLEKGVWREV
jgi:hypothetical protein